MDKTAIIEILKTCSYDDAIDFFEVLKERIGDDGK